MKQNILRSLVLITLLTCTSFAVAADDGFEPLFNGKNLKNWVQHGGVAKYTIEGDTIVGTSVPKTANSFLCSDKEYGDFILLVEFKVDTPLNSGIQIRSQVFEKETEIDLGNGKKREVSADRVHGYQVEIDPSDRAWSGGIYDESRRGWLNDLKDNPKAQKAFKKDEWNKYRIECKGDSIKTWVNGVPAADLKDGLTAKGIIALQVHGVGKDETKIGKQVRWRNVMIKEL
ncbi:MAG: 3-keto-disaccharide hydrolase [Pirellulales bacterium]